MKQQCNISIYTGCPFIFTQGFKQQVNILIFQCEYKTCIMCYISFLLPWCTKH